MDYKYSKEIAAKTSEANANYERFDVVPGIIHQISIFGPAGTHGLAKMQIFYGSHQIWPSTTGKNYNPDDNEIKFSEFYRIGTDEPYLVVKTWNDDDKYKHTLSLRISILPPEALDPFMELKLLLRQFLDRIGVR